MENWYKIKYKMIYEIGTCSQILDKEENEDGSSEHNAHPDGENDGSMYSDSFYLHLYLQTVKLKIA